MKRYIKQLVKNNKTIYNVYFYILSFLLKIVRLFIRVDENLVLYVCYGGKRYDDSPRFVYEKLIKDEKYKHLKHVWAFIEPEKQNITVGAKLKIDTLKYYLTAMKAKYWITNSSVERGLNFKSEKNKNIIFEHGTTAIKKLGKDLEKTNQSFTTKSKSSIDMFIYQGKKELEILSRIYNDPIDIYYQLGLPRNDELLNPTKEKIIKLKEKLNIPKNKKVLFYAPTFREYNKDSSLKHFIVPPMNLKYWQEQLQDEYVVLFTAHYEVDKVLNLPKDNPFVINAVGYQHINDLILVSDILISDYSSIFFDYMITEKPMICFGYDYDEYQKFRGTYINLEEEFKGRFFKDEVDIINKIKSMNYKEEQNFSRKMKEEYIAFYGDTTEKCIKEIFKEGVK